MAYTALKYSDSDVNDVMWKYYYIYKEMWTVDNGPKYSKWDFTAYAGKVHVIHLKIHYVTVCYGGDIVPVTRMKMEIIIFFVVRTMGCACFIVH